MISNDIFWPELPYEKWKDTLETLHMWTQIVGKVKLTLSPFINQWWEVALYITPVGLTTGRIPYKNGAFAVIFNFITQTLHVQTSDGKQTSILLRPRSVAEFYHEFMHMLKSLKIQVRISPRPTEVKNPIPFTEDTKHKSYDSKKIANWFAIQLQSSFIFDRFRTSFRGKSSPVHFFWGSFDLATTRFSGEKLPDKTDWPKGYKFMRYAENEEYFSIGFWPGDKRLSYPAFYSYMYPAPIGYATIKTGPTYSSFNKKLSLYILPYEKVRKKKNPEKEIVNFFETTYNETARLSGWDVKSFKSLRPF